MDEGRTKKQKKKQHKANGTKRAILVVCYFEARASESHPVLISC